MAKRKISNIWASDDEANGNDYGTPGQQSLPKDYSDYFSITQLDHRSSKAFKTEIIDYKVRFSGLHDLNVLEFAETFTNILDQVFKTITCKVSSEDYVRLVITSPSLGYPISIPYMKMSTFSTDIVMERVECVLNSNETLLIDKGLQLNMIHTEFPKAGSGRKLQNQNFATFVRSKRSIVTVPTDYNCCGFALLLGIFAETNPMVRKLQSRVKFFLSRTGQSVIESLYEKCAIPVNTPCGIPELHKFQTVTTTHNIVVYDGCENLLFNGGLAKPNVFLLLHQQHYDLIRSITGFMCKNYFCHRCLKAYDHSHKCSFACQFCYASSCKNLAQVKSEISCIYCNLTWSTNDCFLNHITDKTCATKYKCTQCGHVVNRKMEHKHHCGEHYCKTCKEWYTIEPDREHICYMKPAKLVDSASYEYIYFDIESMTDPSTGKHMANLLVSKEEDKEPIVFEGTDCVDCFMRYVLNKSQKQKSANFIVVAHFLSGFDSYFILNWLYSENIVPKNVITKGSRYLLIELRKNLKFLDSYNFLSCSLRSLPKSFNFSTKMCKGWFPHCLNTTDTQLYHGPFPEMKYFAPGEMTNRDYQEFSKWYECETVKYAGTFYDLKSAMKAYCVDDVEVLETACKKFRNLFFDTSGVDIFANSCTIASAVSLVFRHNFLLPNTLAIIGSNNSDVSRKYSKQSEQWLSYVSAKNQIQIQRALSGGEKKIGRYFVDGFHNDTKTVYEFLGCYIHGCNYCYKDSTFNDYLRKTMGTLRRTTEERLKRLEDYGYKVVTIWSHEWEEMKQSDDTIKTFLKSQDLDRDVLNIRDGLRGGRVSTMVAAYKVKPGEKIFYKDVNSLYPFVLKTKQMPIKSYSIVTENFGPVESYFGIIYCKVLPPDTAILGVLPYSNAEGKLIFPLCSTCSEQQENKRCDHSDENRCLTGVWTHFELLHAFERGYVLKDIYEVWHFKEQSSEIFKGYIDTYLKLKTEASGFPAYCTNEALKEDFIEQWRIREGINLDASKMYKNPGIRAIAKLALNSLWGKFGQKLNFPKSKYVCSYEELIRLLCDARYDVVDAEVAGSNMMLVTSKLKKEIEVPAPFSNLPMACFTTSHARLHLLSLMEKVATRVLYSDTDSIFYVSETDGSELNESIFLGDLKNELEGDFDDNAFISEFYCTGAKSYCYTVNDNGKLTTVYKLKGFTLTKQNNDLLSLDKFKGLIQNRQCSLDMNVFEIKRKKNTAELFNKYSVKELKFTLNKRLLCKDLTTRCIGDKRVDPNFLMHVE